MATSLCDLVLCAPAPAPAPASAEAGADGTGAAGTGADGVGAADLDTVRVVAIDGPSGSGKTTLAADLAAALHARGPHAHVLHLDDLYPGWDGLDATPALLVDGVLAPLARGRRVTARRWDWDAGRPAGPLVVPPCEVLIVEGAGSGSRTVAPWLSVLVWVEAPEPLRHERAMARDGESYRPHWERWAAQERALFVGEGTRGRADVVVTT